ncbi:MAG: exonuclease domain-containing protein [Pseudomonadota bacterium]|nr:exonuclease domain-containing protein [Pseudomonadota bacterium]
MLELDKLLVIDLECTCWEHEVAGNDERQDIIEIGICLFDMQRGAVAAADSLIVRPTRSTVSPFCEKLTSISQAMVDHGLDFQDALAILRERFRSASYPWASWGNFDRHVLMQQCRDFGLDYPMSADHLNLKTLYALRMGLPKAIGLYPAVKRSGLQWEGRHHRGVDDARNTARLLACIFARAG